MKTSLEVLRGARELLSDPSRWARGTFAKDAFGTKVGVSSSSAVSFCAAGALAKVHGSRPSLFHTDPVLKESLMLLSKGLRGEVAERNDHGTHETVLAGFDRAIALAEEQSEGAPLPPVIDKQPRATRPAVSRPAKESVLV